MPRSLGPLVAALIAALMLGACGTKNEATETPAVATGATMARPMPDSGFRIDAMWTVGDAVGDYLPPGIADGLAAFKMPDGNVRLLVNHELAPDQGYPYQLANGTQLTGSRISYFEIDAASREIVGAGLAYDRVRDRAGRLVTNAGQVNELGKSLLGFTGFCSAAGYAAGKFGFVDDIYFAHEEATAEKAHPHGGTVWALDIENREVWALPALGRGSWENSAAVATPDGHEPDGHVAILLGDDLESGGAPLYLWVGQKQPGGTFPARNGLIKGALYVWVAADGSAEPADFHGNGAVREGRFVALNTRAPDAAGTKGHDSEGYLNDLSLRQAARRAGAFFFSRPEDLHTSPNNSSRVVFASTGRGDLYPEDDWGTLYLIDMNIDVLPDQAVAATARLTILYDGDAATPGHGDEGIRNPDNLVWAGDGLVYVQEDMATKINDFGRLSGHEASIWRIDPDAPDKRIRLAEIDRRIVLPVDAADIEPDKTGTWETSGIIDVTDLFGAGEARLLLATVQAHSIRGGAIGGKRMLVQGGQIVWLAEE